MASSTRFDMFADCWMEWISLIDQLILGITKRITRETALRELNLLEECRNQFKAWYKYRFIEDLRTVNRTLLSAGSLINARETLDLIWLSHVISFVIICG